MVARRHLVLPITPGRLPLVLLVAAALAWWLWPSGASGERVAYVPVPVAGTRTLSAPLLLDLLIDESGSTSSTDPSGRRHTEAVSIARWLARYSENPGDRVGVVRFATAAEAIAPVPAAVAPRALAAAFARGTGNLGSGTALTDAVAVTERQLRPYPHHRRLVVILSDGQVSESPAQIGRIVTRLRATADSVYFVGLNGDGVWTRQTHTLFENRGLADVLTLDLFAPNLFAQTLAQIVLGETGQRVVPRPT